MNEISKAKPPENAGEETITEIIQENIPKPNDPILQIENPLS